MKKYHYDLRRRRAQPATARSMGCVDRSDSRCITSLAVCHCAAPFAARNTERRTYGNVYSVVKEQERADSYDNSRLRCAGASATRPHPPGLSCQKYVPLLFISFLGLFFGVWIKFLPEFFLGAEAPVGFLHARSWEKNARSLQFPISSYQERNGR